MSNTLTLLSIPHETAVRTLVQDALIPGVSVGDLVIDAPTAGVGLEQISRIYIAASAYTNPDWPYFGEVDFTYHALDLNETFGELGMEFLLPINCSSMDIAREIGEVLDIHFDPTDIHQEAITLTQMRTVYRLRAAPRSTRWRGWVDVLLHSDTLIRPAI